MFLLYSVVMIAAAVFGTEWLVDVWLGEDRRYWIGLAGVAVLLIASAVVKASGIEQLTRALRKALIGAWIGTALGWFGLKLPWLRKGLRIAGIETEPEAQPPQGGLRWSGLSGWLLALGWAGSMIGLGMMWTGFMR
ncbi:hypothetical protein [Tabrizicola sp.]|uniref:hypothetical protein n=1 Tax=Tabrizicola sp. TaxID=2005166 RepID=UPI003F370D80